MERVILHSDMNNFYASVECMLNPELKAYPIAVCGDVEERHGIVLAKNYKAKAKGVSTGEAIWQAKQKCPGLLIVPPHYDEYMKYSKKARAIYGRYTDEIEPFGMDECWLDVSGSTRASYVRSDNIISAVSENIRHLKPPLRGIFESFVAESTTITPDVRVAIMHMRDKISDTIFEEWCDTLVSCQNDRTLKDTLMPVVSKLTDVRLVNNSLKTMLSEVRREYYMMVAMVVANIPLLYCLNKDWYNALMNTMFGKIVLAICGVVIVVTFFKMNKYTKPVEYKR